MGAQLAAMLRVHALFFWNRSVHVERGRNDWSQIHGKLAEVAVTDDPMTALQALLKLAKDASSSRALIRTLEKSVPKASPHLVRSLVLLVADEFNMTPLCDSGEPVHMVDEDSNFCEANVHRIIKCSPELSAPNAPYAVVSIVGAQSSGKSYLLNRLFGTKFPEMDPRHGRSQTTRGIMISRCIGPSLLLLDVEGFDGREKGQNTTFEKQAALFALTLSDLMMVNMSVFDIGREQGVSTTLFRTIFQERAKLPPGFTKILVVLRHYDGETPLEILKKDVLESLEKIWKSVNIESVKFKDYIEVNMVGLPDKISPEFPKEVTLLRKLLSDIKSGKVPASGFLLSSSRYWDKIKKNEELDIPSHQIVVAKYFCGKLVEDTLGSINFHEKYKLLKAAESVGRFKEIWPELLENIITEYHLKTKNYDPEVREKERQNLVDRLHKIFKDDSRVLVWKVQDTIIEHYKCEFVGKNIQNMEDADADLSKYVEEFMSSCEDEEVFDLDHLRRICGELKKKLQLYTAKTIKDELDRKAFKKAKKLGYMKTALRIGLNVATGDVTGIVLSVCSAVGGAYIWKRKHPEAQDPADSNLPSSSCEQNVDLSID